jgi:uncharacterized protein (TIGR00730 family)
VSQGALIPPAGASHTVALFGSGNPPAEIIVLAEEVGRRIAEQGWVLKNGGYGGTMAAAARGARGAGGRVIGVTCGAFGRTGPNPYLSEAVETEDLLERLRRLIDGADAFGVFAGGTGTLTELLLTWEMMVKGLLEPRVICLIGPGWERWWAYVQGEAELASHAALLSRAPDATEAVRVLGPEMQRTGGRSSSSAATERVND